MAKLIEISSTTTIHVTCGTNALDVTNPDAHVADRLRVAPSWTKNIICIKEGKGEYPADIATWATVKALERDGVITIGRTIDTDDAKAEAECAEFARKQAEVEAATTEAKTTAKTAAKTTATKTTARKSAVKSLADASEG